MNLLKRTICFVAALSGTLLHSTSWADNLKFTGNWEYIEHVGTSSNPYSTFEIKLDETSDGTVTGSYCFVTQSGNRIDCDASGAKNITGHIKNDGLHAEVDFYSFFGAKGGVADLTINDNSLTWIVTSDPTGDFFYGPYSVTLKKKQPDLQEGEHHIVVNKAYLYRGPSKVDIKTSVTKGDYVRLSSISGDLKYWNVSYLKNGNEIKGWIDCRAIDFCP